MAGPTLIVDGVDLSTTALITSFEGILRTAPTRGDLIEFDWQAGAVWQPGPSEAYSFEVPLVMREQTPDKAVADLRAIQGLRGRQVTVQRVTLEDGVEVTEECEAVITAAIDVSWDFRERSKVGCVLVFQNLSGGWV
jgi:hypothetical protein